MAQKKVFKGVINGVEFNNVADYNAEMNKLVEAGADIEASSQTVIENVDEVMTENVDESNDCCKCQEEQPIVRMLHGFDTNEHYLDVNVDIDKGVNEILYMNLTKELGDMFPVIESRVDEMDLASLNSYRRDILNVLEYLENDSLSTREAIEVCSKRLAILDNCRPVIDKYFEFYRNVLKKIDSGIDRLNHIKNTEDTRSRNTVSQIIREIFNLK